MKLKNACESMRFIVIASLLPNIKHAVARVHRDCYFNVACGDGNLADVWYNSLATPATSGALRSIWLL